MLNLRWSTILSNQGPIVFPIRIKLGKYMGQSNRKQPLCPDEQGLLNILMAPNKANKANACPHWSLALGTVELVSHLPVLVSQHFFRQI